MKYKCDRCLTEHELDETKVKNKQHYVSPFSCYEGDYYIDYYYWFPCSCGRPIKVDIKDIKNPLEVEKDYYEHSGVCFSI